MEEAGRLHEKHSNVDLVGLEVTFAADSPVPDQVPCSMDLDVPVGSGDCQVFGDGVSMSDSREDRKESAEQVEGSGAQSSGDEGAGRATNLELSQISAGQGSLPESIALEETELSSLPQSPSCGNPNEPFVAVDFQTVAKAGPEITLGVVFPNSPHPLGDFEGKEGDSEIHQAQTEPKQPDDGTAEMEGIQLPTASAENGSSPCQPGTVVDVGAGSVKTESTEIVLLQDVRRSADTPQPDDTVLAEQEEAGTNSVLTIGTPVIIKSDVVAAEYESTSAAHLCGLHYAVSVVVPDVAPNISASPSPRAKTELQREMELYEAAEREEDERKELLSSVRPRELRGADPFLLDHRNDKKRPSDSPGTARKKKRGRKSQSTDIARDIGKEIIREEEDVCFICFDGGNLVLCDRRNCPKAYHLKCIDRDEEFFQKKGAWICGWHFCCVCTKSASFQCYTCPSGYCVTCKKDVDFLCISKRKGLCEECRPVVNMIEKNLSVNPEGVAVDFNDQETHEYLFKEYWQYLKQRLQIILPQFDEDGKVVEGSAPAVEGPSDSDSEKDDELSDSEKEDDEEEQDEAGSDVPMRRKRSKNELDEAPPQDADYDGGEEDEAEANGGKPIVREFDGWASKELLDFLKHMNHDGQRPMNNFAVNKVLWIYIKRHNLQDPQEKTKIHCDERLRTLFPKKEVWKTEIFRYLQHHYAPKEKKTRSGRSTSTSLVIAEDAQQAEPDIMIDDKTARLKERRKNKKREEFVRPNLNDYAAVSRKNIELIYLKRTLLEFLLDDPDFTNKAVSSFVRIRVPGMTSKTEMCYRLVQIIGTKSQPELYKAGRKMTNIVLEILNLQKKEEVTVDLVSNQDFTEEECQRLRQSIKCGFIKAPTVGELEEKAMALQAAKFNDWFETEQARLTSLRDRASETGRKKELRECVEKLKELNSPSFRAAKLQARPEVTTDPRMDPAYESDVADDKHGSDLETWEKSPSRSGKDKDAYNINADDSYSGKGDRDTQRSKHASHEKKSSAKDSSQHSERSGTKVSFGHTKVYGEYDGNVEKEKKKSTWDKDLWRNQRDRDQPRERSSASGWKMSEKNSSTSERWLDKPDITPSSQYSRLDPRIGYTDTPAIEERAEWAWKREPLDASSLPSVPSVGVVPQVGQLNTAAADILEREKAWHYRDPTGTVQGPFSMEQLRKWNTTGLFPVDLRVWKTSQQDQPKLLIDALAGSNVKEREVRSMPVPQVNSLGDYGVQLPGNPHYALSGSTSGVNGGVGRLVDSWQDNGSWNGREGTDTVGRVSAWGASISGDRVARQARVDWEGASNRADGSFMKSGGGLWSPTEPEVLQKDLDVWAPASRVSGNGGWSSKGVDSVGGRSPPRAASWGSPQDGGNGRASWSRNHDDELHRRDSSRIGRSSTREARKETPCKFYKNGYCKRGDTCHFMH